MEPVSDSLVAMSLGEALSKYKAVYKMIVAQPFGSLYADLASYLLNLPVTELEEIANKIKFKAVGVWTVHRLKDELDVAIEKRLARGLNDAIQLDSQRLLELIKQNQEPFVEGHARRQAYDQESYETWTRFFQYWGKIFAKRKDSASFDVDDLHSYVIELRAFYNAFTTFTEFIEKWLLPSNGVYPWYDETFGRHLSNFAIPDGSHLVYTSEAFKKGSSRHTADACVWQYQKLLEKRMEFFEGLLQLCTQEIDTLLRWKKEEERQDCQAIVANVLALQRQKTEEIVDKLKRLKVCIAWKNYRNIDEKFGCAREKLDTLTLECLKCKEELRLALGKYFAEMHIAELKKLQLLKLKIEESLGTVRSTFSGISNKVRQEVEKSVGEIRNVFHLWEDFILHNNTVLTSETKKFLRVVNNWPAVDEYFKTVDRKVSNLVDYDERERDGLVTLQRKT